MAPAAPKKTFFILRSLIYRPDDLIKLGQVVKDPRTPYIRLAEPLPLTDRLEPRIVKSSDWSLTLNDAGDRDISIFAHVLQTLKASGGASASQAEDLQRQGALLETQYFEISEDPTYVERLAQIEAIRKELKNFGNPLMLLYLVTGVKIVRWPGVAVHHQTDSSNLEGKIEAVVEAEGSLRAGVGASTRKSNSATVTETPDTAYVVAYRLRRLRVSWSRRLKIGSEQDGAELSSAGTMSGEISSGDDSTGEERSSKDWEMKILAETQDFDSVPSSANRRVKAIDDDGSACFVLEAK
ncbi:hypothetical protein E8E14_002520 [Neopestalotiopsis sp. 37M]|nr:hypothetical protein E8E14_002520 [Neopestalotiopsis sp. 37M]